MLWFFKSFFPVVWISFLLYWRIKAGVTKTTQRSEADAAGIVRALVFLFVIVLLSVPRIPVLSWLYLELWPSDIWSFSVGAAVTVVGLLFAVWARQHLASNWSSAVTIKQGHEFITTGPYAMVRHPIYTGILTGFLGTAIALAQLRGVLGFVLIFIVLWAKLRKEEEWMRSQFGETYTTYTDQTTRLVPYLF